MKHSLGPDTITKSTIWWGFSRTMHGKTAPSCGLHSQGGVSSSPFTVETWHPAHLATGPCDWCVHDWTQEPVLSLQLHLSMTTPLTDPRRPSWQPVNNDWTLILSDSLCAKLLSRGHHRCGECASHTRLQVPTVVLNGQGLRTVFHLHCRAPSCRLACVH